MITIKIELDYTLVQLKEKYRQYLTIPESEPVSKKDITRWIQSMTEAQLLELENEIK